MKKTYFAWANAERTAWNEMTGEEFYQFIQRAENRNRKFIPADDEEDTENANIYMEVTIEDYREWDRKRKRHVREAQIPPIEILSTEMVLRTDSSGNEFTLGDTLFDDTQETEKKEELLSALSNAISELSEEDQDIIRIAYFEDPTLKETEMGALLNMPQSTFNYRKKKILKNLQKKLVENHFLSK